MSPPDSPAVPSTQPVSCQVNGKPCSLSLPPDTSLMDALRENLDLISPKNGCAPQGQCGCCTVMLDGKAVVSCVVDARKAEGDENRCRAYSS